VTIEGNQTHPSLLIRLRDREDAVAWELVFQFTSKRGLQAADAADVTQGLSEGAVYIARSRVIARLRAQVETATGDWTDLQVTAA
jgi:hypothetical protein